MNWLNRLNRAKKQNERLTREMQIAKEALRIEGQNKILSAQFGMMETVQQKLVNAELKGLQESLKKNLPQIAQAHQESGEREMSKYLQSVKTRALPPQSKQR